MNEEYKKEERFKDRLKSLIDLSEEEKASKMGIEMYYQGVQYANDEVPWEEIVHMGLDNEEAFVRGYNETLEKLGKSR